MDFAIGLVGGLGLFLLECFIWGMVSKKLPEVK